MTKTKERKLRQVFNAFDLDASGSIEKDEFLEIGRARRAGLVRKGVGGAIGVWTESKNERLMNRVDLNRDGMIQWSEFYIYFTEVWHGGMEMFSEHDFADTVENFTEAVQEVVKNRSNGNSQPPRAVPSPQHSPSPTADP